MIKKLLFYFILIYMVIFNLVQVLFLWILLINVLILKKTMMDILSVALGIIRNEKV